MSYRWLYIYNPQKRRIFVYAAREYEHNQPEKHERGTIMLEYRRADKHPSTPLYARASEEEKHPIKPVSCITMWMWERDDDLARELILKERKECIFARMHDLEAKLRSLDKELLLITKTPGDVEVKAR